MQLLASLGFAGPFAIAHEGRREFRETSRLECYALGCRYYAGRASMVLDSVLPVALKMALYPSFSATRNDG